MVYDERFVAFLDILGFKNMIQFTTDNIEYQEKIRNILNYISEIRNDNYHGKLAEYGCFKEVSVFSGSIVISYSSSLDIGGALFHVLMDFVYICNDLLTNGIYVRGGVSCGQMYHDKKVCFGPAMVRSYEIENKIAIYPRIVIDPLALSMGLDFLSQHQEFNSPLHYNHFLESLKLNIVSHLNAGYPIKIAQKYFWFANYYNETIEKVYENHPADRLIDLETYTISSHFFRHILQ